MGTNVSHPTNNQPDPPLVRHVIVVDLLDKSLMICSCRTTGEESSTASDFGRYMPSIAAADTSSLHADATLISVVDHLSEYEGPEITTRIMARGYNPEDVTNKTPHLKVA